MGKLIFITGGARSGKSSFAQTMAEDIGGKDVIFIATCEPLDNEMKERIKLHKAGRPAAWDTREVPRDMHKTIADLSKDKRPVLIDCLGLYVTNLICAKRSPEYIRQHAEHLAGILAARKAVTIVVSNDVGSGIVPMNKLARVFRDILGTCNQIMAKHAQDVYVLHSGIPLKIKSKGKNVIIG